MKIVETTFKRLPRERLEIGFEGENLRATVRIDCASVFAEYPNATPALIIKPLFADAYPVVVDRNGTDVDWLITSEILSFTGDGEIQLVFYKDQVICKSAVSKIRVCRSLQVTGEMPDPVAQWVDDANAKLHEVDAQIVELEGMVDTATDAATRAEQSASTASTKAEQAAGSAATATAKANEATQAAGTATAKAAEAQTAAQTATEKANAAAESERIATAKAAEAAQSAQTAAQKAGQITEAAQIATGKAEEASASATAAQTSATNAASSATAAQASQTAAQASETAAGASATQAAQSVLDAGANAQTAMQKAAEATQSATNAAASATSAAMSAETASTKAGEAAQSAQAVAETAEQLAESLEQIDQNTQDIAEHEQAYNALKAATLIHSTASGAIASFPDGAEMPVDELKVQIEPVQDLHGYDHPWPAGGGKNKWSEADPSYTGMKIYEFDAPIMLANHTYTISATLEIDNPEYTTAIIFYGNRSSTGYASNLYFSEGVTSKTFTPSIDIDKLSFYATSSGATNPGVSATWTHFQIEEGSTATAYAPYSNICPITGWDGVKVSRTGKNLLEPRFYRGVDYNKRVGQYVLYGVGLVDITESITTSGNTFSQTGSSWGLSMCLVADVGQLTGKQIRVSGTFTGDLNVNNGLRSAWYFTDENYIVTRVAGAMNINPPYVLTPAEGEKYLIWYINSSASGTITLDSPMLELGSTATDYEPYQGETYDITFPSDAGTVYGGTLDVATGELVVNKAYLSKRIGDMNNTDNYPGWTSSGVKNIIGAKYNNVISGAICSILRSQYIWVNTKGISDTLFFFPLSGLGNKTQSELIAAYPDLIVDFVIPLAEPITYTLTAPEIRTLLGQNNIWADTGDVSVKYKADTKLYIDGKIAELVAQIVNS